MDGRPAVTPRLGDRGDARVLALTVATWVVYFAFLIYLRRYFVLAAT